MGDKVTAGSSWSSPSCSAVTVTVCSMSQSWSVKVRSVLSSDTSVPAWPDMATVTLPAGWVFRTTVYVAACPSVREISVGTIVTPKTSSSVIVMATVSAVMPS